MNHLWTQLVAAAGLVCVMALVHAVGVVAITNALGFKDRTLRLHRVDLSALARSASMALGLFAAFYVLVGAMTHFEPALYFSTSAYTTLGTIETSLPDDWRLVGAIEGLIGFLLIGWSTGVFFADMNKLLREQESGE